MKLFGILIGSLSAAPLIIGGQDAVDGQFPHQV